MPAGKFFSFVDAAFLHSDNLRRMKETAIKTGFVICNDVPQSARAGMVRGEFLRGAVAGKPAVLFIGGRGTCVLAIRQTEFATGKARDAFALQARQTFDGLPSELGNRGDLQVAARPENTQEVDYCLITLARYIRGDLQS
jgi:hypothetical protein